MAAMVSCALVASSAFGQSLRHPVSVRPASLSSDSYYGYYYGDEDEEAASPSDAVAAPQADEPAPVVGSGCCDPCCDTVGCDGGCGSACGGGCDSCFLIGDSEAFTLWPDDSPIKIGGWTALGYHNKVTPLSVNRGDALSFNDTPDALNLHQQWVYMEKALDTDNGFDWGGRVDFMYGTDSAKTQAFGTLGGWDNDWDHGVYGFALPQAYLEVGAGNLSVKGGHFYTLVGYEVVTSPGNFFYSHALTMFNSEPFTHTGFVASYTAGDDLTLHGGWTLGWDTGFRQFNNGSSWLGGFSYSMADCVTFTYMSTAGDLGWRGKDAYTHSLVFDFTLTDKLNYVLQSDYVRAGDTTSGYAQGTPRDSDDDIGINQYLFYNLNDCWGFGTRIEWWKDEGHSYYEGTLGLNYRPMANLVLRPEIRHDWQPFANFDQTTFGIDAVLVY